MSEPYERVGPDFTRTGVHGLTPTKWLHFPVASMPTLVEQYVKAIEIEQTNKYCTCEWIVHPDDTELAEGARRIRKGEASPDCWVHTKEGFILGFFTWVFKVREHPIKAQMTGIRNEPGIKIAIKEQEQKEFILNNTGLPFEDFKTQWEARFNSHELSAEEIKAYIKKHTPKGGISIQNTTQLKEGLIGEHGPELTNFTPEQIEEFKQYWKDNYAGDQAVFIKESLGTWPVNDAPTD